VDAREATAYDARPWTTGTAEGGSVAGAHWFVAFCRANQEQLAKQHLSRQRFLVYLPLLRLSRRRRGAWVDVIEPLFSRYLFVRFDPTRRSSTRVRSTRGVIDLVRFGGEPATIADDVIAQLRGFERDGAHVDAPRQKPGDSVRILEGPLGGLTASFVKYDGTQRAWVLLDLLGQHQRLNLSRHLLGEA
jgi:transcriptional antiterminator RfaH